MLRRLPLSIVALTIIACSPSSDSMSSVPPPDWGKRTVGERGMVSSAHPLASDAGLNILREGGNAVDAAVATAFAIGVVEPQMSGLGGSGSALIWLDGTRQAEYLNFYAANPARPFFALPDMAFVDSTLRLRATGVPTAVAGLLAMHERFGSLPRSTIMAPAIRLAREGFPVNQILAQMVASNRERLAADPFARRQFLPDGKPILPGTLIRNPELADVLETVSDQGASGFYEGEVAKRLVSALNGGGHPATLTDLADYSPEWKRPLCGVYRGNTVLSAPPPQSGMQIIQTLKLLAPFNLDSLGLPTHSATAFSVMVSALRVGMADNQANTDPNWATVPARGIISDEFARRRAREVTAGSPHDTIAAGDAGRFDRAGADDGCAIFQPYGEAFVVEGGLPNDEEDAHGETTHVSVVDEKGNAVSLTQTNSSVFGTGVTVSGFFLNNSGFRFTEEHRSVRSRSQWRVRRSTISPTIVLRGDDVHMVIGAPGGLRIPTAIVQNMVYMLDYGMDPLNALRMPRLFPNPNTLRVQLEHGFDSELLAQTRRLGYEPAALSFGYARIYAIVRRGNQWIGVADPRHDGQARGY